MPRFRCCCPTAEGPHRCPWESTAAAATRALERAGIGRVIVLGPAPAGQWMLIAAHANRETGPGLAARKDLPPGRRC